MPFVALAYYADCNYKKIRHDENIINQCIDAIKENYDVLIDLGYEVRPQSDYEMVYLNDQLKILKRESKIETKTSDELDQYFPTNESQEAGAVNQ